VGDPSSVTRSVTSPSTAICVRVHWSGVRAPPGSTATITSYDPGANSMGSVPRVQGSSPVMGTYWPLKLKGSASTSSQSAPIGRSGAVSPITESITRCVAPSSPATSNVIVPGTGGEGSVVVAGAAIDSALGSVEPHPPTSRPNRIDPMRTRLAYCRNVTGTSNGLPAGNRREASTP
jgi:hypothetical protein